MTTPLLKNTETDISSVIKIHKHAFEGFLKKMGHHFLNAYYKIILS